MGGCGRSDMVEISQKDLRSQVKSSRVYSSPGSNRAFHGISMFYPNFERFESLDLHVAFRSKTKSSKFEVVLAFVFRRDDSD